MSLAAVPAFFLARRVVSDRLALLAALLTIAVPSLAYGTVMTENVFTRCSSSSPSCSRASL